MCFGKNTDQNSFTLEDLWLTSSKVEEILGVTTNKKLTFNSHVKKICRKAVQKVSVIPRIAESVNTNLKAP